MSINVQCPGCSKNIRTKDELAGKRVKCPGCGQIILVPVAEPASGLQPKNQSQDQLPDAKKAKAQTAPPSKMQTAPREGLQVLHKKNGTPTTLFVPERCDAFGVKDQELLKTLLTSLRIHSWVNIKVGDVPLRIVSAVMPLPIASPQFEGEPLMPLRHPAITFPPGDFFSQYHVVVNSENDATSQKFLNHGLYFSTQMADANIVSFSRTIYVIPNAQIDAFFANLAKRGADAFKGFDSFDDPTADLIDAHGLIAERGSKRGSKADCLVPSASESQPDDSSAARQKDLALAKLVNSIETSCQAAYEKQTSAMKIAVNLASVLGGLVAGLATLGIGIGMFSLSIEMLSREPREGSTQGGFIVVLLALPAFCFMFVAPFFAGFQIARLLTAMFCPAPMEVRKRLEVLEAKFPEFIASVGGLYLRVARYDGKWELRPKPIHKLPSGAGLLDETKRRDVLCADPSAFYQQRLLQQEAEREQHRKAVTPVAKPAQPGFTSQLLSVADIQRNDQEMGEMYLQCPKCGEEERINDMGKMMLKQGNNVFANYKCKKCGVAFDGAKHNVKRNA